MKILLTMAASVALAASMGCSQNRAQESNNNDDQAQPAASTSDQVTTNQQSASLDPMDKNFIQEAATGGKLEVELGQLAEKNASSQQVKEFGQRMVTDHSKANENLMDVASKVNVTPPTSLTQDEQEKKEKLSKLHGAKFDQEYMSMMVDEHQKDVDKFQQQAQNAINSDVKSFAANTLPILQEHLQLAKSVNDSLGSGKGK